jgi:ABC-type glycerol-3-phosphate transport system permease component
LKLKKPGFSRKTWFLFLAFARKMLFQGQFASSYPLINAGVLLSILPVLILYIVLQKHFVSGITTGALKE